MKLLTTTAAMVALTAATATAAPLFDFTVPGSYAPTLAPGTYDIVAIGAGGGSSDGAGIAPPGTPVGGVGAIVQGTFTFGSAETLTILVGGQGALGFESGGGGGGSFVVGPGITPLLIAGGGGGAGISSGFPATGIANVVRPVRGFGERTIPLRPV